MDDILGPSAATPTKVGSTRQAAQPGNTAAPNPDELAGHRARLQADCELRDALAAEGFAGPAYGEFADDLASYGYEVMMAWLATGQIFDHCRQAGLGLQVLPVPISDHEDLAQDTVAATLNAFKRQGLQQGRPAGTLNRRGCPALAASPPTRGIDAALLRRSERGADCLGHGHQARCGEEPHGAGDEHASLDPRGRAIGPSTAFWCSTGAPAASDRPAIESQSVRLSANFLRPE